MCAKLVKGTTKYTSNDEVLYQLHWLPVQQRIKFKILTLVHKCINCKAPTYLENLLIHHPYTRQGLQSQSMGKRLVSLGYTGQPLQQDPLAMWDPFGGTNYLTISSPLNCKDSSKNTYLGSIFSDYFPKSMVLYILNSPKLFINYIILNLIKCLM